MTQPDRSPLFAHAMWRSGSTYLASQFARCDRYMLFYEPLHEGIGRKPSKARARDRSRDRNLRHPSIEGGYFGAYEQLDPRTGLKLTAGFAQEASLRGVFGLPSPRTLDFLRALDACARANDQSAFLGFCRSGMQMPVAQRQLGAHGLHLWRDPREQFASYGWPQNDYFMAGTLLQLALSPALAHLACALAPRAMRHPLLKLALILPDRQARSKYRIARQVARNLSAEVSYALFYLSWIASFEAARPVSQFSFSLTQLAHEPDLRAAVERHYGVTFEGLKPTPSTGTDGSLSYAAVETNVSGMVSRLTVLPWASGV